VSGRFRREQEIESFSSKEREMADESEFSQYYSEKSFWEKIAKYAVIVGKEGIRNALILYYTLTLPSSQVPAWAKAVIIGALGYFIFPLDAIPDVIPIIGYADDISVLAAALGVIAMHVPPEARQLADEKIKEWFGR
jgi:uncharacterized membrane protein YkvA (DUF1232 family)